MANLSKKSKNVSSFDKFFQITERGSNVRTEIIAGLTTFFAMAYIVFTNPTQIAGSSYEELSGPLLNIWHAVYIASILAAIIGTLLMALYAKMPFAQACGMGLNSFFFVSFVLPEILKGDEGDVISGYHSGLIIILISGFIFLALSLTGLREKIAKALPDCLKKAIPAGIGLFIAFIGFKNAGILQDNQYTFLQFVDIPDAIKDYEFTTLVLPALLALLGLVIIAVLEKKKVKGSVIISIASITVLYYVIMFLAVKKTPDFNLGQIKETFVDFGKYGISGVFKGSSWTGAFSGEGIGAIFSAIMLIVTFCLVDMFDTIGTLYGTASQADMLDKDGDPVNVDKCMASDSIATVAGAVCGTSTCTTYVESASGVAAGGRTGLTSLVVAACFAVCLFLSPLASIVPACATAPALIYVGVLMLKGFSKVDMEDMRSAVPAFLALIMMPLTYSISNGIGIGAIAYVVITACTGKYTKKDIPVTIIALLFALRFFTVYM